MHDKERGECCPDFSCCQPQLFAPEEVRVMFRNAYLKGDEDAVMRMLGEFLSKALAKLVPEKNVYIAGLEAARQELD